MYDLKKILPYPRVRKGKRWSESRSEVCYHDAVQKPFGEILRGVSVNLVGLLKKTIGLLLGNSLSPTTLNFDDLRDLRVRKFDLSDTRNFNNSYSFIVPLA